MKDNIFVLFIIFNILVTLILLGRYLLSIIIIIIIIIYNSSLLYNMTYTVYIYTF